MVGSPQLPEFGPALELTKLSMVGMAFDERLTEIRRDMDFSGTMTLWRMVHHLTVRSLRKIHLGAVIEIVQKLAGGFSSLSQCLSLMP